MNLQETRMIALLWHGDQKYGDSDLPYSYHLDAVRAQVEASGGCVKAQQVALLHDILEDTACLYASLVVKFGGDVALAVYLLTKNATVSYANYIARIRDNPLALQVKIADTYCNLTESLKAGNLKRIRKYSKQMYLLTKEE